MTVSIREVARQAGVSRQTVSGVLGNLQHLYREETCQRVLDVARRLNYRPNGAAKAVFRRTMQNIGVLLINTAGSDPEHVSYNHSVFELLLGINARLQKHNYMMSLINVYDVDGDSGGQSRIFSERLIDGLVIIGKLDCSVTEKLLYSLDIPLLWLEANVWQERGCVRRDEEHAGRLAAEKAVAAGYRRLLYAGFPPIPVGDHFSAQLRWDGVRNQSRESGVELESVIAASCHFSDIDLPGIRRGLEPDTAVIAYDGDMAAWLHIEMARNGLLAGRDYGLCSCEDYGSSIARILPDLARVHFDRFRLGREAGGMILRKVEAKGERPMENSLMIRDDWLPGNTLPDRTGG